MTDVGTLGKAAWRDFNTDGVPSSGLHKPLKSDIRSFVTEIEARKTSIVALMAALATYVGATEAALAKARDVVGDGGGGAFAFISGDQSANVAADPRGAIFKAPDSDPTGGSGAWKRIEHALHTIYWYGGRTDLPNNSGAFQAAARSGTKVYIPAGVFDIGDEIDMDEWGTHFEGAGPGSTYLRFTTANAQHIRMTGGGCSISGLTLRASVTQTGGYFIGTGLVGPNRIYNVEFDAPFVGVSIGVGLTQVSDCYFHHMVAGTGIGILVLFGSGLEVRNSIMSCPLDAQCAAGIKVIRCDDLQIPSCQFYGCGYDLYVANDAHSIGSIIATNTFFDTATRGLYVKPANGMQVLRLQFTGCWFGTHFQDGIAMDCTNGVVSSAQISGCLIANNGLGGSGGGINTVGTGSSILEVTITGCGIAGNKDAGISLAAGCKGWTIVGNRIGRIDGLVQNANNWGIYDNGADNYLIVGNDMRANTTSPMVGYTSTDTRIANDNLGFITKKDGFTDSASTDASGDITITHGMHATPRTVIPVLHGVGANLLAQPHTLTSTTFKVRFVDLSGAALISTALGRRVSWRAAA